MYPGFCGVAILVTRPRTHGVGWIDAAIRTLSVCAWRVPNAGVGGCGRSLGSRRSRWLTPAVCCSACGRGVRFSFGANHSGHPGAVQSIPDTPKALKKDQAHISRPLNVALLKALRIRCQSRNRLRCWPSTSVLDIDDTRCGRPRWC